jgi:hypothetical protein
MVVEKQTVTKLGKKFPVHNEALYYKGEIPFESQLRFRACNAPGDLNKDMIASIPIILNSPYFRVLTCLFRYSREGREP